MKILIIGVNGFIGNELTGAILRDTSWEVCGMDLYQDRIDHYLSDNRFTFKQGDMTREMDWIHNKIKECDVVLPLAAVATPINYVKNPLGVFNSVFENNLAIIKMCHKYKRRIIFPSTSEVYGMSEDSEFNESSSNLVLGPIEKERWIYSCSKQLLDRVIWAYGHEGLPFTIFRPFNWIGPTQDSIHTEQKGSARVLTQFIGHIARQEPILLVDGGHQMRSFTDIRDGVDALIKIIRNDNNQACGKIFNIGNPKNNVSIQKIADTLIKVCLKHPYWGDKAKRIEIRKISKEEYYGPGYQDVRQRLPDIRAAEDELDWHPEFLLEDSLSDILDHHSQTLAQQVTHVNS